MLRRGPFDACIDLHTRFPAEQSSWCLTEIITPIVRDSTFQCIVIAKIRSRRACLNLICRKCMISQYRYSNCRPSDGLVMSWRSLEMQHTRSGYKTLSLSRIVVYLYIHSSVVIAAYKTRPGSSHVSPARVVTENRECIFPRSKKLDEL